MKTLADYIKAVQLEEGTDLHAQAEDHLSKANDADAKGDNYAYHMHMTNHHEALSQWHDSKGRGGMAAKHEDLAAKHEDKAEDAREASSKRGMKENAGNIEEGLKQKLGAAALAGSMAMGAHARVVPGQDEPGVNRLTGKPNIAQVASHDSTETENPSLKGFSTSYLQKAADPNRSGRFMISAEHAKAELASRESSQEKRTQDVKEAYGGLRGDVGDRSKREFKHRELEHELGHEVNPRASFNRPSSSDVPHAVHIGGKKWKTFSSQSHASNVARKIPGATVHKEEYVAEASNTMQRYGQLILKRAKAAREAEAREKAEQEKAEQEKANKEKKPGVAEQYVIKHKETGKTLSTHDDEASAKDEHTGLGDDKSKYKVIKTSTSTKSFKMNEET